MSDRASIKIVFLRGGPVEKDKARLGLAAESEVRRTAAGRQYVIVTGGL